MPMSVAHYQLTGIKPPLLPFGSSAISSWPFYAPVFPDFTFIDNNSMHFDKHLTILKAKYIITINKILPGRPHLSEENGLVFASDVLTGGHFPEIVHEVNTIPIADRIQFVQFLIEYKLRSNDRSVCRLCNDALSGDVHLCPKCIHKRGKCLGCNDDAFIASARCLKCAAASAFFSTGLTQ